MKNFYLLTLLSIYGSIYGSNVDSLHNCSLTSIICFGNDHESFKRSSEYNILYRVSPECSIRIQCGKSSFDPIYNNPEEKKMQIRNARLSALTGESEKRSLAFAVGYMDVKRKMDTFNVKRRAK